MIVDSLYPKLHARIFAVDLDLDGDLDVLGAVLTGRRLRSGQRSCVVRERRHPRTGLVRLDRAPVDDATRTMRGRPSQADLDGDGDLGRTSVSIAVYDDTVAWYENDGSQKLHAPATITTVGRLGASSVFAADMDRDGDTGRAVDMPTTTIQSHGMRTTAIRVSPRTSSQPPLVALSALSVDAIRMSTETVTWMSSMCDRQVDDEIGWYENDGSQNFSEHIITSQHRGLTPQSSMVAADVDGDGDCRCALSASAFMTTR